MLLQEAHCLISLHHAIFSYFARSKINALLQEGQRILRNQYEAYPWEETSKEFLIFTLRLKLSGYDPHFLFELLKYFLDRNNQIRGNFHTVQVRIEILEAKRKKIGKYPVFHLICA